ncbi:MAG: hypothetical protein GY759_00580 [Chloroflexi bacterium]|nr:hypothetical protein [Chloroflexota bacterium]
MGVTIHYTGKLKDMAALPNLTLAVQNACRELGWRSIAIDERVLGTADILVFSDDVTSEEERWRFDTYAVDDRWRGVLVLPPECEPLWLTFSRDGALIVYDSGPSSFQLPGHYNARDRLFTKTQFGTPDTHIAICSLLHLVESCGVDLEVSDEGGYFENEDREQLQYLMGFLDEAIERMSSEEGRALLEEILGEEIEGEIEVRKKIGSPIPDWRRDWGISANEN